MGDMPNSFPSLSVFSPAKKTVPLDEFADIAAWLIDKGTNIQLRNSIPRGENLITITRTVGIYFPPSSLNSIHFKTTLA